MRRATQWSKRTGWLAAALWCAATSMFAADEAPSPAPKLQAVRDDAGRVTRVEVLGLAPATLKTYQQDAESAAAALQVTTAGAAGAANASLPAIAGAYAVQNGALTFTPRFSFRAGMKYQATFAPPGAARVALDFELPPPPQTEPTRVSAVYPSGPELPENQLRFYFHFSAPMSRGEVYDRVTLLDGEGREMELPFLELGEELWDVSGTRLTLLMDPGRIKRGVKPREEDGTVLRAGEKYTLVIDSSWPDAEGRPLAADYEKTFRVGPPVERALDVAEWKIERPAPGSREPLTIAFPWPLDHALAERTLRVFDARDELVVGRVQVGEHERRWEFTPQADWSGETYTLVVDAVLEDGAGNRVGVPFEQLSKTPDAAPGDDSNFHPDVAKTTRIPIELKPKR